MMTWADSPYPALHPLRSCAECAHGQRVGHARVQCAPRNTTCKDNCVCALFESRAHANAVIEIEALRRSHVPDA